MSFRKNERQVVATDLMTTHAEVLLEGGSRSGKTFIEIRNFIFRGIKYPRTRHLALRRCFNHAKMSLWHQTIPDVFAKCFPGAKYEFNKSDWFVTFGEGSELWIAGTDDKDRVEKILGTEWASILFNEVSEQTYDTYELIKTRVNPPRGVKPLICLDQNPGSKSHWTYKRYHLGIDPITGQPLSEDVRAKLATLLMNPDCNKDNLSDTYIDTLNGLSEAKKRRFLYGEYSDDTAKSLWKRNWIDTTRINTKHDYTRIIVAIDPNVTDDKNASDKTDEAGIVAVGQYKVGNDYHYDVLADESTPGLSWGMAAVELFKRLSADKIIAEVNQGGDLVQMNIRNYDRQIADRHYDSVRATRGKEIRAEPIADLYRLGFVHHLGCYPELEQELCEWIPGEGRSPNRLDALVWAIAYLSGIIKQPLKLSSGSGLNI